MAWNDYVTEHGFNSSRYKNVTFKVTKTKAQIKDMIYSFNQKAGSNEQNVEILTTPADNDLYMIGWFLVASANNTNATGRGIWNGDPNDSRFKPVCTCSVTASGATYTGNVNNLPLGEISPNGNSTPFWYPTTQQGCEVNCNFPIFAVNNSQATNFLTLAVSYAKSGDFSIFDSIIEAGNAINLNYDDSIDTEPEGTEFTIYNTGQRGTWSLGDIVTDVSTPYYRWAKVKLATTNQVDGRLAFYKAGLEDDILKLKPISVADVVACEYSTDGGASWQSSDTFPFDYIYAERTNELGTFIYATRSGLGGQTGVPVFEDEETATKWVNHDSNVDITDASNYEQISNRYPQTNKTGQAESSTDMGTANTFRSHFTQKYLLDRADVSVIVNALFDTSTNIFEDIKKGLEMFGEKIIDSICGLAYYPIDLTTVFNNYSIQSYIYFGGYQFRPEGFSVNKIISYNGYLDLGSFTIEPTYPDINDIRNYTPYCNVSIYLPYCGLFQLNYNKYVGKTVSVRYYIDINTGGCLVCLFADGLLYDYFNGNMATQIPITVTDYSGFANAELRNLSNLAGVGANVATLGATGVASAVAGAGQVGGVALGGAGAGVDFAKAMYDLSTTNINNFNSTKGSSGAIGNQYLPQYIYLIFEYVDVEETANLIQLEGKPSNKSGTINSFSGYLEVDSVNLVCSGATEGEKQEIRRLLSSGIII